MVEVVELAKLHRTLDQLRTCVGDVRSRYGDTPVVRRLIGDVDRIDIDASELDAVRLPSPPAAETGIQFIEDKPIDPALWADADDEGVGGYHGGGMPR
ncbi:MAG: hypothetical protein JWO63_2294 [Frankiales bacterium]|nr:hypothetical protein [Frankiales bacterium]